MFQEIQILDWHQIDLSVKVTPLSKKDVVRDVSFQGDALLLRPPPAHHQQQGVRASGHLHLPQQHGRDRQRRRDGQDVRPED